MWLASCTKLATTTAVMQCVERGLLKLDDDVIEILPELKRLRILKGFNEESKKPIMADNTQTITLT
jgi:CubicO group peptidase (beta-lactamase class C family)